MQIDKSNKIFPFFIFSFCLHLAVLFAIFYNAQVKEDKFIQIPIDVDFISPVEVNKAANNEQSKPESAEKVHKVKEVEKDSIKIEKKTKKKEPKKKVEEKKQKVKERQKKEVKEVKKEIKKEDEELPNTKPGSNIDPFNVTSNSGNKGVMFENTNFKFSYYANSIVKKIRRNWQWASAYRSLRAVIYFKINRDGDVIATKIKESSGNTEFDENATRAIVLSSPFAPLPDAYTEDDLGVYFEFKFN